MTELDELDKAYADAKGAAQMLEKARGHHFTNQAIHNEINEALGVVRTLIRKIDSAVAYEETPVEIPVRRTA